MRALSLARLEFGRFSRGRLPRAAMAALLLLPLLYGALYLWSFWDPYGRLDKLPVALVNEDRAVTVEGGRVDAGRDLAAKLRQSHTFGWQDTTAADAEKGLTTGRYYLTLTIPAGFSAGIASSNGDHPERGTLQVRTNDSNNYIVGSISRTVFSEVRAAASAKASAAFYDKIFLGFSDLHDRTREAADGAARLTAGANQAHDGSAQLADGTARAKDGTEQLAAGGRDARSGATDLAAGLDKAKQGSSSLDDGIARIDDNLAKLTTGAQQVADGTRRLTDQVDPLARKISPLLHTYPEEIRTAARLTADAADKLSTDLKDLPGRSSAVLADARTLSARIDASYARHCPGGSPAPGHDAADCRTEAELSDIGHRLVTAAERADALVREATPALDELAAHADEVEKLARKLADTDLAAEFDAKVADLHRLDDGAHQVADGAARLKQGTATALTGIRSLDSGLGRLDDGAHRLSGGIYRLSTGMTALDSATGQLADGAARLDDGLGTLADGSSRLTAGLQDGAGKIPDYTDGQRAARTTAMSDPVALARQELNKAPNYGTGFAPYFMPLALWVGAMVTYMLMRPLGPRALAGNAPSWRVALAGWLPAAAIGLAQAAALLAVLHWGLGLEAERTAGLIGYLALTVVCFTALMQWINARFGPAGRLLALALLMLQLTSAGGTYPVESSPGFFNAIHPFLPMTYVVAGLRRLISGGDLTAVWTGSAVLAAFWAGALALTVLTARRRQVWTLSRLHPELSL
ncbi:putative membrane protein [Streptomyces sp. TLI_235]|nr:YhgE/Pip domain-containing protein [Streptomyces sp. TLI_235]PBC78408.1 putative membrane protein [Streptomyces sp. TLI_235]